MTAVPTPAGAAAAANPAPHAVDQPTRHVRSLDALRGVAALTVVFHHLGLGYADRIGADVAGSPWWRAVDHAGHSSVVIFFVLSGYVLQSSYAATTGFTYGSYLLKRFFRIYPALLAALLAAWTLYVLADIPKVANGPMMLVDLARHAALLCWIGNDIALDTPIWSLAYEVRFSLVFPLMAWSIVRRPTLTLVLLFALHFAATAVLWNSAQPLILGYGRVRGLAITVYYLICFGIGMYGQRYVSEHRLPTLPPLAELVVVPALVAILLAFRNELIGSLAGMGLILLCVSPGSRLSRWLGTPALLWLGSISYSLYLLHAIVLAAILGSPLVDWPYPVTVVTVVALSLGVGAVSYRWIERPGITLGRYAARRWMGQRGR